MDSVVFSVDLDVRILIKQNSVPAFLARESLTSVTSPLDSSLVIAAAVSSQGRVEKDVKPRDL